MVRKQEEGMKEKEVIYRLFCELAQGSCRTRTCKESSILQLEKKKQESHFSFFSPRWTISHSKSSKPQGLLGRVQVHYPISLLIHISYHLNCSRCQIVYIYIYRGMSLFLIERELWEENIQKRMLVSWLYMKYKNH